jgi:hypothetical protein
MDEIERRELEFLEYFVKFIEAKTVVEIGVQIGTMAIHLCRASNFNGGQYIGFDIWSAHGMIGQFNQSGTKEYVTEDLLSCGLKDFTLIQVDTLNNREFFISELRRLCPNGIDFAFIDADHSYKGIANDFFAVYPLLNPAGVIAFHDTRSIDGCREFIFDLRTKYNDGTFDISDYPFGINTRRTGVTLLTKRSYHVLPMGIDEICGSVSEAQDIENMEVKWGDQQAHNGNSMPDKFNGEMLINKIGQYDGRKKFTKI